MAKDEIKLTHSGILSSKGEPFMSVRFDRGNDFAEGSVPSGKITKSSGFTDEEIANLETYLQENSTNLMARAKKISGILHWF